MTGLLVSVRDEKEALAAIAGGVELLDVKEPDRGALGAADEATINRILAAVGNTVPVSIALGELTGATDPLPSFSPGRIAYAKLGLAGALRDGNWAECWRRAIESICQWSQAVGVAYVDAEKVEAPRPDEVIEKAIEFGCAAILFDTFTKQGSNLFDYADAEQLTKWIDRARQNDLTVVLGGALSAQSMPRADKLGVDYVAVRTAACQGGRRGAINTDRVRGLRAILDRSAKA